MTPQDQPPIPSPVQQVGPSPLPYPGEQDDPAGYVDRLPTAHPLTGATAVPPVSPSTPYRAGQRAPYTGEECSDKTAVVGGLLQLFLGGVGAGRFYIGDTGRAVAQLALTIIVFAIPSVVLTVWLFLGVSAWAFADAIIIFTGNTRDDRGRRVK